jgi:hypothetical protein
MNKDKSLITHPHSREKLEGVHECCKSLQLVETWNSNANLNKNGHDSHSGLLPYDNNG